MILIHHPILWIKYPEKTVGQNPAQWVDLHMKPETVLGMFS